MDSLPNSEEPCSEGAGELFVLNPLDMEIIIEQVLSNAETSDVTNCRLLCKRWNKEGVKELLRRDKYVTISSYKRYRFENCMEIVRKSKYPALLRSIHIDERDLLHNEKGQFIHSHGKHLRELYIKFTEDIIGKWQQISSVLLSVDLWAPDLTKLSITDSFPEERDGDDGDDESELIDSSSSSADESEYENCACFLCSELGFYDDSGSEITDSISSADESESKVYSSEDDESEEKTEVAANINSKVNQQSSKAQPSAKTPKHEFPSSVIPLELRKPLKIEEIIINPAEYDLEDLYPQIESCLIRIIKASPSLRSLRIKFPDASLNFIQEVTKVKHVIENLDKLVVDLDAGEFQNDSSPKLQHLCSVKFNNLRVVHLSGVKVSARQFDALMQNLSTTVKKLKLSEIDDEENENIRGGLVKVLEFLPNLEYLTFNEAGNRKYPTVLADLEKYQIVHQHLKYLKLKYANQFEDQTETTKITKLPVLRDAFPNLKHLDFQISRLVLPSRSKRVFYKQMQILSTFSNLETLSLLLDAFSDKEDIFTALSLLKRNSNLKHLTLIHVCSSHAYECKHIVSSTIKGFTKALLELKNLKSITIFDCKTLFKGENATQFIQDFAEREGINLIQVNDPHKCNENPFENDYENRFDCWNPTEV